MVEKLLEEFGLAPYGENTTKRLTIPAAEEILFKPFPVLDHGFVRLVDYMGSDLSVDEAARVSYGTGTRKVSVTRGLIRYLMRHRHTTPTEMVELKFHAKMPIFVARQWIRHRTANVNEYSGRYSIMPAEFYVPEQDVIAEQSRSNNQGREGVFNPEEARKVQELIFGSASEAFENYDYLLNEDLENPGTPLDQERGMLARELARMGLPLNTYTQWYWKIDLHNLFHFLGLRMDSHAQWEVREYANAMAEITQAVAPNSYEAFDDYVLKAVSITGPEMEIFKNLLSGTDQQNLELLAKDLPPREGREFLEKMASILEED